MIQRIQTIWLALAAIFEGLTFQFPFYTGDWKEDNVNTAVDLNARTTTAFTVITAIAVLVAVVAIFLFRNRRQQQFLCGVGIGITVMALGLYTFELRDFLTGSFAVWAIIYGAAILFFVLASRGVRADEKLVKSMDRLR